MECPYLYVLDEDEEKEVKMYNGLSKGKFKLCCDVGMENLGIPFFYNFPIQDYFSLDAVLKIPNLTEVFIDGTFIYNIENVAEIIRKAGKEVRVVPNVAYSDAFPREDGVLGGWIRPEDLDEYAEFIDTIEFQNTEFNAKREAALYRIYIENKHWDGSLNQLITKLNYPGPCLNRMIDPENSKRRRTCGQSCLTRGSGCRLCYHLLELADPELYKGKEQFNEYTKE